MYLSSNSTATISFPDKTEQDWINCSGNTYINISGWRKTIDVDQSPVRYKYEVFQDHLPAKSPECPVNKSWDNNEFSTLQDAIEYTNRWLGEYGPLPATITAELDSGEVDKIVFEYCDFNTISIVRTKI